MECVRKQGYVDTRYISGLMLFFVVLVGGFFYSYQHRHDTPIQLLELHGRLLATPKLISDFALVDDQGMPFSLENLRGRWTFMVFGFTACQDVCPRLLAELSEVDNKLRAQNSLMPQFVMVSVDPEHDSPPLLHQYIKNFNLDFVAATGEPQQIRELAKELSVFYLKIKNNEGDVGATQYTIDQGGTIMLINPQGQLRAVFPLPHTADIIAKDYRSIVSEVMRRDRFGFLLKKKQALH